MNLQQSLDTIVSDGTNFSESFYRQLAEDFPTVFSHFDGVDMKHQAHMLNTSLLLCVHEKNMPNDSLKHFLRILGTKHHRMGIQRMEYEKWIQTLLRSLESYHGEQWHSELADEWQAALAMATEQIFFGYDEAYHM